MINIQTRKLNFIEEFLRIGDEKIIKKLELLLKTEKKKVYERTLKPMSHDEFYNMVDKSLQDSKNGNVISTKELKEKVKQWK